MQQDLSIKRATEDDAGIVAQLLFGLLDELAGGQGPTLASLTDTASRLIAARRVLPILAYDRAQPIGVMTLNECAAIYAGGLFGEISELYVLPDYRSRGVAPLMMAEAKVIARESEWTRLEVGAPDQPAWSRTLSFYLREGFVEVGPRLKFLIEGC